WRLYPRFLVSVDGRYEEVYPERAVYRAADALTPDAEAFTLALTELKPDYILLRADRAGYHQRARFGDSWRTVYDDTAFAILAHKSAETFNAPAFSPRGAIWKPSF
ncbi:MAG: hypothetical protein KDD44_04815, partial [Bdellovibrionales bacterium]|nr:hypothetical protein [Bdellovibrionales bacterium]